MTNTANLKRFSDRTEQILSTIKSGNRMSLGTSGDLKTQLEAITDKYSSVLVEAPQDPVKGDKWFDGKSTWTYDTDAQAWLPDFVTPNKSYFSFAATVTANTATDLTQAIEIQDNDFYKVTIDFVSATGAWQVFFTVKEDNGAKIWNGTSWVGQDTEVDYHSFSGDTDSVAHLVFRSISKSSEADHSKFKLVITSTTSSDYRGTAVIDHLATGALTDGAVYDTTTGGGGGSGDGFQPDRVIVIDTTLTEAVPGKAYPTFAAAKTYMDANPSLKFCVELPAGDFGGVNNAITLSEQWEIHGNNTVLTSAVDSTSFVDVANQDRMAPSRIFLSNCRITKGFTPSVLSDEFSLKNYIVRNCIITQACPDVDAPGTGAIVTAVDSVVDTSTASPGSLANSMMSYFIADTSIVLMLELANGTIVCHKSIVDTVVSNNKAMFVSCDIGFNRGMEGFGTIRLPKATVESCAIWGDYFYSTSSSKDEFEFRNCSFRAGRFGSAVANSLAIFSFKGCAFTYTVDTQSDAYPVSEVTFENSTCDDFRIQVSRKLFANDGSHISVISSNPVDLIDSDPFSSITFQSSHPFTGTTDARKYPVMYSTDGGTSMTNVPTGATHVGIFKGRSVGDSSIGVNNYMWFPMPN